LFHKIKFVEKLLQKFYFLGIFVRGLSSQDIDDVLVFNFQVTMKCGYLWLVGRSKRSLDLISFGSWSFDIDRALRGWRVLC
jgi:hypothetical protein